MPNTDEHQKSNELGKDLSATKAFPNYLVKEVRV